MCEGEGEALGEALGRGEPATVARLEAAPPEVRAEVGDNAEAVAGAAGVAEASQARMEGAT